MSGSFIDTDILVHLASSHAVKAAKAEEIAAAGGIISVQVVGELTTVARRQMPLSWPRPTACWTCGGAC